MGAVRLVALLADLILGAWGAVEQAAEACERNVVGGSLTLGEIAIVVSHGLQGFEGAREHAIFLKLLHDRQCFVVRHVFLLMRSPLTVILL
jgi:hypothetical protein